jgi:hypothetical protein
MAAEASGKPRIGELNLIRCAAQTLISSVSKLIETVTK